MADTKTVYAGPGLATLLTVVFVTLKLLGITVVATWSWWWVVSPLWISALVSIGMLILFLIGVGAYLLFSKDKKQAVPPYKLHRRI